MTLTELVRSSPWRRWAKGAALPCCSMVATALREAAGHHVANPASWQTYYRQDATWWHKANVTDPTWPWSSIDAAKELVGGVAVYVNRVTDVAPPIRPGRWHVVQRWQGLNLGDEAGVSDDRFQPGATGHTYLVFGLGGEQVRVVQSSEAKGYRDTVGTWTGDAGLAGYAVSVLTLPEGV
jgi:hypothetical protein